MPVLEKKGKTEYSKLYKSFAGYAYADNIRLLA